MNRPAQFATLAALAFCPPAAALAQAPAAVANEDGGLITWAVAAGLAAVVLLAGFLNPKRSHLT